MYIVEFYEKANGESKLWDFLEKLRLQADTGKDTRIQFKQISLYIQFLEDNGIWEFRPGNNHIFYFFFKNDTFIFLHQFHKKTQKTPRREIEKAKSERDDYLSRKGRL